MAEVRSARRAPHFRADHAERGVLDELDGLGADRLVEARPAAAGVELRAALEELGAACAAGVEAGASLVEQLAGPGALGRRLAQHGVLVVAELLAPLVFGLFHAVRHESSWGPLHSPLSRGAGLR